MGRGVTLNRPTLTGWSVAPYLPLARDPNVANRLYLWHLTGIISRYYIELRHILREEYHGDLTNALRSLDLVDNLPKTEGRRSAVPVLDPITVWDDLDEAEAELRAKAAYIDGLDGDATEFEKALRYVEKRRGELLGPADRGGDRRSDNFQITSKLIEKSDVHPMTASRYRQIARHWDDVRDHSNDAFSGWALSVWTTG